ncbi:catalase family peroxidase [Shewanella mesophila]|uniref:catalase family peroxidase n=1 Tax=Shewanella mesophila TaxID=2864208 RepID=UPI001C657742|nr:catalase family peroxidase [Shewanella mesophila]QYJ85494.1 catalase family peroxidase [Shewanella mesophila]
MVKLAKLSFLFLPTLLLGQTASAEVQGNDFIQVFEQLSGKQPGVRKGHAKGVCVVGEFAPSTAALQYSSSALFTAESVKASIRFSMAGGNPAANETERSPRGVGVQFKLPDGRVHNIAGLTTPVFPGKDPQTFLGLLQTLVPNEQGRIDFAKVKQYRQEHPSTQAQFNWLQSHNPPSSYSRVQYYGIHSFNFVDDKGDKTKFKWQLAPVAGELALTEQQMKQLPPTFLADKLKQELSTGSVLFELHAIIGYEDDVTNDPSQFWPKDRQTISLGLQTINQSGDNRCDGINYDPNVLSKGIEPSDDPVLRLRSTVYAISFGKRLSGN